jgi:hypothetical protein
MLVHLAHRKHTLSLLGMQSLYRGLQCWVYCMVYDKIDERLTDSPGMAELYEASRSGWGKIVHGQRAPSLILIVSLSL